MSRARISKRASMVRGSSDYTWSRMQEITNLSRTDLARLYPDLSIPELLKMEAVS